MYLCYIDESGTTDIPGNTSHYVLAGLSIPIQRWKECDWNIETVKRKYQLQNTEVHVAWILRSYLEQTRIANFQALTYPQRRSQVEQFRNSELLRLQRASNPKLYRQTRKNFQKTEPYAHLTQQERKDFVRDIGRSISQWPFARLFAECIDKIYFDASRTGHTIDEQSFEQIVSRFEQYLQNVGKFDPAPCCGLLIHDNNATVAKKRTDLMRQFHQKGTMWTTVQNIIETPLFVDSQLTSMVQIADVCAYAMRRYLENSEDWLFNLIFQRADQKDGIVVGVRHYTKPGCTCKICSSHKKTTP